MRKINVQSNKSEWGENCFHLNKRILKNILLDTSTENIHKFEISLPHCYIFTLKLFLMWIWLSSEIFITRVNILLYVLLFHISLMNNFPFIRIFHIFGILNDNTASTIICGSLSYVHSSDLIYFQFFTVELFHIQKCVYVCVPQCSLQHCLQ